jgi:hypothetical protein
MIKNQSYHILLSLVAVLLCIPLVSVTYPPLSDYPNHLAGVHIFANYDQNPLFGQRYERLLMPVPNLGLQILMVPLVSIVGVFTASKILLVGVALLYLAGLHVLARSIRGGPSILAPLLAFSVFNSMFLYGFVNCVMGYGLFFLSFGLWLEWRSRWTPMRLFLMCLLPLACYLTHLTSYAFLGISVAVFSLVDLWQKRQWTLQWFLGVAPLIGPVLLAVSFVGDKAQEKKIVWNTLQGKAVGLLTPFLTYSLYWDLARLLALGVFVAIAVYSARQRRIELAPALTALVLLVFFLGLPLEYIKNSGVGLDTRLAVPLIVLAVLSIRLEIPRPLQRALTVAILGIGISRMVEITWTWHKLQPSFDAQLAALAQVEKGASIYNVFLNAGDRDESKRNRSFAHVANYLTITRDAKVSSLFAEAGQVLKWRQLPSYPLGLPPGSPQRDAAWQEYEYMWLFDPAHQIPARDLQSRFRLIASDAKWSLWKSMTLR